MYDDYEERPRKMADWKLLAQEQLASLCAQRKAEGLAPPQPVQDSSRKLAKNAWGAAWMRHLAYCEEIGFSLAQGRSLLRYGCVLDIALREGAIDALVCGEEIYAVHLRLDALEEERISHLQTQCSGHIDSYISLLEGRVDAAVMEQLCEPEQGLLPAPSDWHRDCNCPDWQDPCAHVAAAIYAAGCLIDKDPQLLFKLRGLAWQDLCAPNAQMEDFNSDELSATFGVQFDLN